MENILRSELYPLRETVYEDKNCTEPSIPKLNGEYFEYIGNTLEGKLCISNYRICHQDNNTTFFNVPLGLIDLIEIKHVHWLHIVCKDATSCKCAFASAEMCGEWFKRLVKAISSPCETKYFFAFAFYAHFMDHPTDEVAERLGHEPYPPYSYRENFQSEWERMKFDEAPIKWRQSYANQNYELCETYPKYVIVPSGIDDSLLKSSADFRSNQRFPVVVWRHQKNGAVIARSSQPQVGVLGWRKKEDETLLEQIMKASGTVSDDSKKLLIMDARSYTAAYSNRIRSGGYEFVEYYPFCEMSWMKLVNIHDVRASFQALQNCCQTATNTSWWKSVDGTNWLQNMHLLMISAVNLAATIELEARPVLVHCSDGWDRTPQLVALAELLLDPFYRTIKGFQILVEREWLEFGHKFDDRCGRNEKTSERSPVFLQWLDCVYNLLLQFPKEFQFNSMFLVKLAQHTYANLFGTFLCNSSKDREEKMVSSQTFSVWKFLNHQGYKNHLYCENNVERVLWPSSNVCDLSIWKDLYQANTSSNSYETGSGGSPPSGEGGGGMNGTNGVLDNGFTSLTSNDRLSISSGESCDGYLTNNKQELTNGYKEFNGNGMLNGHSKNHSSNSLTFSNATVTSSLSSSSSSTSSTSICKTLANGNHTPNNIENLLETELENEQNLDLRKTSSVIAIRNAKNSCSPSALENSTDTLIAGASSYGSSCNSHTFVFPTFDTTPDPELPTSQQPIPSTSVSTRTSPPVPSCVRKRISQFDPVDGLTILKDEAQSRIEQMIVDNRARELELEREIYSLKMKLSEICQDLIPRHVNCTGATASSTTTASDKPEDEGSVCSTDVSWEAVEEREAQPTLWVPDHAVTKCMQCESQFWLGRRKHHCRSCGKIFCADCSENVVALPCEQLYEPVRVCQQCYRRNPPPKLNQFEEENNKSESTLNNNNNNNQNILNGLTNNELSVSSKTLLSNSLNNLLSSSTNSLTSSSSNSSPLIKSIESCKQAAAVEDSNMNALHSTTSTS